MNKTGAPALLFLSVVLFCLACVLCFAGRVHAQDVPSIDIPMIVAVTANIPDGSDKAAPVAEKAPDYMGVDLLAQWEGDRSPKISRFHDRQSGVEFICIRDRGCVLTGRKW